MSKSNSDLITKQLKNMEKKGNTIFFGAEMGEDDRAHISKGGSPNRPFVKLGEAYEKHQDRVRESIHERAGLFFKRP